MDLLLSINIVIGMKVDIEKDFNVLLSYEDKCLIEIKLVYSAILRVNMFQKNCDVVN